MAGTGRLARLLRLGAAYDTGMALLILTVPGRLGRLLDIAPPEPVWTRLIAVLLLLVAGFYLLAAGAPGVVRAGTALAGLGRLAGGALLLARAAAGGGPGWVVLGAVDLGFAAFHLGALMTQARRADPGGGGESPRCRASPSSHASQPPSPRRRTPPRSTSCAPRRSDG